MVHVELTDVDWFEVAVFTVIFFVDRVWVSVLDNGSSVDCVTSILTGN